MANVQKISPSLWFDGQGGDPKAQQCGWLKDKYGLSWQIVPAVMEQMMTSTARAKSGSVMNALLRMKKLDLATLQKACDA